MHRYNKIRELIFYVQSQSQIQSQSYFMTGGLPPICSSWRQAPRDPRPVILFSNWTLAVIVLCNILSHERMGLSFTIAAGPCQRSHSQVRVPRDSWPYFTVSDSRLTQPRRPGSCIYISQALGSLFVASYDSQGYGGGIRPRLHTRILYLPFTIYWISDIIRPAVTILLRVY
jgi:hypothetical protein